MNRDAKAIGLAAAGVLAVFGASVAVARWQNLAPSPPVIVRPNAAFSVVDDAGVLSAGEKKQLEIKLNKLRAEVGPQLVVSTIKSLDGRDIQAFTDDWANDRRVGETTKGEGMVILVAPTDKKVRISYTNNLRGQLSDAYCSKVIKEKMLPSFRQGSMFNGIDAGVDALYAELRRVNANLISPSSAPARQPATGG